MPHLRHESVDGHLGQFYNLDIVNGTVINMGEQVSLLYADFDSLGYVPGSYSRSLWYSSFIFLRTLHTDLLSILTSLHSHQQCIRVAFAPHPCQHLLVFVLLVVANLSGMSWNFSIVLICNSLVAKDVEYFFMCLLAICTSFEKCPFNSFAHFLLDYLFFWCSVFWVLYILWMLILCWMNNWQRFSLLCRLFIYCLLWCTEAFWCDSISFVDSSLISWAIWVLFRKSLPMSVYWSVFCMFSFGNFRV
jgi:hypothetical protein